MIDNSKHIWIRRSDLEGIILYDAIVNVKNQLEIGKDGKILKGSSVYFELGENLAANLNFTRRAALPPDGSWGVR